MMKLFFSFTVLIIAGFVSDTIPHKIGENTLKVCDLPRNSFHENEEIRYKIYYNASIFWIAVGEVHFQIKGTEDHLILKAIGTTYPSYDWIFPVRDTVITTLDRKTLKPIENVRIVHEGKFHRYDHMFFNYETNMVVSHRGNSKSETEKKSVEMTSCSKDVLSTIYGLRGLDINLFKTFSACDFDLFLDRNNYPVKMNYLGKEKENIKDMGRTEVHVFNPELVKS